MKTFFYSLLALAAIAPASATTVTTPVNGATVTSPFQLVASTSTCAAKPAVAMGYSIDHNKATIETTSFSTMVSATLGQHTLHVKCWGKKVNDEVLLSIKVVASTTTPPTTAATPVFSPVPGSYTSAQTVSLVSSTPGAVIYYTTNGSAPTTSSPQYSGDIAVNSTEVIEAIAVAPGYKNSGLGRGDYVISAETSPNPLVPPDAIAVDQIQAMPKWKFNHDPGTQGSSTGIMSLVEEPSVSGQTAKFATKFEDWGGEIYSRSYATDPNATNFLYDARVWIEEGSKIGNLEMDNNQVIPNGDTVIYAFQCAGDHNTWDYSENAGTPKHPNVKWMRSNQPCNPADWTPNEWHHVQISYSRDGVGNITYHSVWLDGVEQPINETVPGAFALGWAHGDLMTNFQVDGVGSSGASTLYLDNLTIYRW